MQSTAEQTRSPPKSVRSWSAPMVGPASAAASLPRSPVQENSHSRAGQKRRKSPDSCFPEGGRPSSRSFKFGLTIDNAYIYFFGTPANVATNDQLQAWQPAFVDDGVPDRHAGAVHVAVRQAFNLCAVRMPHAIVADILRAGDDFALSQQPRLRRDTEGHDELLEARGPVRLRRIGPAVVQAWLEQRAPDHHVGGIEPVALLGGGGGIGHIAQESARFASHLFRMPRWRVHRRYGGRMEPDRRRRPAIDGLFDREPLAWNLDLRRPDTAAFGVERNANRKMVFRI